MKSDLSDFVYPASLDVAKGECDRGIFVDGVGYGSALIANKINGILRRGLLGILSALSLPASTLTPTSFA